MADPFEEYDQYRAQHQTLGGNLPSEEDEARQRARVAAYNRLNQRGFGPMMAAGAREAVSGMPVISAIPGIREFAEPSSMTPEGQDLADFRLGSPGAATVFNIAGRTLPYAALGNAVPQLMRTGIRAAGTMGAGQGADAYLHGENPAPAAFTGAIGGFLGAQPIKTITPRARGAAIAGRERFNAPARAEIDKLNTQATDANVKALERILARGGGNREIIEAHRNASRNLEEQVRLAANPPMRIPPIEDPFYKDTITGGLLGGGLGFLTQTHPGMGVMVGGLVAPHVGKFIRRKANETISAFNKRLESSARGRQINRFIRDTYMNNTVVPDRMRSMINAIGGATGSKLLDRYGEPPPTLGGN